MIPNLPEPIAVILKNMGVIWGNVWWVVLPALFAPFFWYWWNYYIHYKWLVAIRWKLLEIKIPKDILQTPRAMEQIFAAAHAPYSYGLRFLEIHWEGKGEYFMSFEFVSLGGEIHLYLRTPAQFQNLMESAIYSQYPNAEVREVDPADDYVKKMPKVMPNKVFQTHGLEFVLSKESCYPIRTYISFEDPVEERRVDPISALTELMSKLKSEEQIWVQFLIRPTGSDWKDECDEVVNKMMGRDKKIKTSSPPLFGVTLQEAVRSPFEHPSLEVKKEDKKNNDFKFLVLSPTEKEALEGIERKTAKLGFETTLRFIYVDHRDSFSRDNVMGVMGVFRQFSTQNLNLLRPYKPTMTAAVHGLFKETRLNYRRRVIFERYRDLTLSPKKPVPILNIEELATICHFPITAVTSPQLQRIESKKGTPPPNLPILENERHYE